MQDRIVPTVTTVRYLPENFLNKSVNEVFVKNIMSIVLEKKDWEQGNADNREPDYFCGNIPFEITIASNDKKRGNYVQRLQSGEYRTDNIEDDVYEYIRVAIEKKRKKLYSVQNVHLCVLCLINLTFWVLDEYGSVTQDASTVARDDFFGWIEDVCIKEGKFENVFLIFPDLSARWWVWDMRTKQKASVQLFANHILSKEVPFWIAEEDYNAIVGS